MSKKETSSKQTNKKQRSGFMGGGGPVAMIPGEKAKDFKGTLKKLLKYIGNYKIGIIIVLVFAILSTVFTILGPRILGEATNKLFEGLIGSALGTTDSIDFISIGEIILKLLGLYLASVAFSYIQGYVMSGISMKITYKLRKEISVKLNKLPFSYFDKKSSGEILSYITNDIDTISQSLSQSMTQIITSITSLIGILIMMFSISVSLTFVTLCVVPLSFIFVMFIVKKSQKYFIKQQEYLGHINGHIEEMYSNHTVVKAFNNEEESIRQFNEYNKTLYTTSWKSQFLSGMMFPIMNFIGNIGYVAMCVLGGNLVIGKKISIGDIQAFLQYVRQFNQPITQVANISNVLQQTMAAAERVFEFLDEKEEIEDTNNPLDTDNIKGQVEFKNVKFGYDEDRIIINDFSALIQQGQKVAIVGHTGAGKTTIVKLLMRFYELNGGNILIDGMSTKDFTRNDLRSQFGMVLQDAWLYNASIMENIRYGKLDATDEEVIQAAKIAQVDHFVHTLPDGYNMILNEEASNVSQGQRQLLTIARAVLANPKILILDEATSSVDTRTEVLIQKAMDNIMKGRTSFVIAHRLSTIKNADIIFVMENGNIVEHGSHEELIIQNGVYAELYNSQFDEEEE